MKIDLENLLYQEKMMAKELAEKSGVPESTISNIITGKTKTPNIRTLIKFCKVLNCGIEKMILDIDDEKKTRLKVS